MWLVALLFIALVIFACVMIYAAIYYTVLMAGILIIYGVPPIHFYVIFNNVKDKFKHSSPDANKYISIAMTCLLTAGYWFLLGSPVTFYEKAVAKNDLSKVQLANIKTIYRNSWGSLYGHHYVEIINNNNFDIDEINITISYLSHRNKLIDKAERKYYKIIAAGKTGKLFIDGSIYRRFNYSKSDDSMDVMEVGIDNYSNLPIISSRIDITSYNNMKNVHAIYWIIAGIVSISIVGGYIHLVNKR